MSQQWSLPTALSILHFFCLFYHLVVLKSFEEHLYDVTKGSTQQIYLQVIVTTVCTRCSFWRLWEALRIGFDMTHNTWMLSNQGPPGVVCVCFGIIGARDDGLQGNIHSNCIHFLQQDSGKVPVFSTTHAPPASAPTLPKVLMDAWARFRDPHVNFATV